MCQVNKEIFSQDAFNEFRGKEIRPGSKANTDKEIDEFVRKYADSAYHPCCTLRLGKKMAVVDCTAKVHGLENIRVIDVNNAWHYKWES